MGTVVKNVPVRDMARIVSRAERTPEGYLHAKVVATKPGIFEYRASDGKMLRCLRSRAEVNKPESLRSLANVPLTFYHPEVPGKLLTADTAKQFMVGSTGNEVEGGDLVTTSVHIFDKSSADATENGNDEVSCGYSANWSFVPGSDPEFGDYDCSQSDMTYNHLAIGLPPGDARAGREARVLLDSVTHTIDSEEKTMPENMTKMKLDDMEYDVPQNLADAMKKHMKNLDAEKMKGMAELTKHLSKLKSYQPAASADGDGDEDDAEEEEMSEAATDSKVIRVYLDAKKRLREVLRSSSKQEATIDSMTKKVEAAKELSSNARFADLVKNRVETLSKAVAIMDALGQEVDIAALMKMETPDMMKHVVKAINPQNATIDSKDASYIQARFDAEAEELGTVDMGRVLGAIVSGDPEPGITDSAPQARAAWSPKALTASKRVAA